jgi:hypothetical protein
MAQFTLADIPGAFNRGLQFRQDTQLRPLEIAAAQQNVANAEQNFRTGEQNLRAGEQNMQFNQTKQRALEQDTKFRSDDQKNLDFVRSALRIQSLPDDQKLQALRENRQTIINNDGDTSDTDAGIKLAEAGDFETLNQGINNIVASGERQGIIEPLGGQISAEQQTFENLIKDFSPEDKTKARRRKAGLDARAVGSAVQTIAETGTAATIANVETVLASAKETGKLTAQLKLKPEVEAAVIMATGQAKLEVDKIGKNRSNKRALDVYTGAMSNLTKTLDNTITGPFLGLTAGLTSNAQIADGAIAMMLPLMKDVFRGAGEGTFTEGDQKILTDLIPTRSTFAEARVAQIKMIDTIIRSKLSAEPTVSDQPLSEEELLELQELRSQNLGATNG